MAAAQVRPADELVREGLGLAREGRLDEAAAVLEQGRRENPRDVRFPLELAGLRYRSKDFAGARRLLRSALRIDPGNRYGNEFLGSLYLLDGNAGAAVRYWNRIDQPVVGSVQFSPPPRLGPVRLARLPAVSPGQVLTERRLQATLANLRDTGIFTASRLRLDPRADDRYDLTIETESREAARDGRWWWRLLPYLRGLPYQNVTADFPNLDGNTTNLGTLWRWDSNKRRVALDLNGPVGRSRYRVGVDARDETWDLRRTGGPDGLVLRKIEAGGEGIFRVSETVRWSSGVWVSGREYRGGGSAPAFDGGWLVEMRNRLTAPVFLLPEHRLRVDGSASLRTGRFLSGSGPAKFVSPELGVSAQWFPQARGEKYVVNAQVRAGGAYGRVPLDEMFQLGMERDNPLWLRGHVGTRDGRKGNAPLGREFLLVNTDVEREMLRVLFLRVYAGPFFDFGGTRDPSGQFGSRGMLYDAGIQVTIRTVAGIRISAVYGRDLRGGRPAFYTAVTR